jgi:DNA-binding XRE family transcriptional regulator
MSGSDSSAGEGIRFNHQLRPRQESGGTRLMRDAPGLAAARQSVGLTVEELADITDVSPQRILQLEGGGYASVLVVSSLQAFFGRVHNIDIREEP